MALQKDKLRRLTWKFNLGLTHPVEDRSIDSENFGSFSSELGFHP
jgi:hypothetical protein